MSHRLRGALAGVILAVAVSSCADSGNPARLPELEAEVRAAVGALLDSPGFVGTVVRTGEDRTVARVDWADYRASGDYRYVAAGFPATGHAPAVFGLVQIGTDLYSARRGGEGDQPWARLDEDPTERIPLSLNLAEIAAGTTSPVADVPGSSELSRETSVAGEVRWAMDSPHEDDRLIQVWVIGADGVLRSYSIRTDRGSIIQGGDTAIDYGFTPIPDPAAITPPTIGSPLDLADLGVPADLPLVE